MGGGPTRSQRPVGHRRRGLHDPRRHRLRPRLRGLPARGGHRRAEGVGRRRRGRRPGAQGLADHLLQRPRGRADPGQPGAGDRVGGHGPDPRLHVPRHGRPHPEASAHGAVLGHDRPDSRRGGHHRAAGRHLGQGVQTSPARPTSPPPPPTTPSPAACCWGRRCCASSASWSSAWPSCSSRSTRCASACSPSSWGSSASSRASSSWCRSAGSCRWLSASSS